MPRYSHANVCKRANADTFERTNIDKFITSKPDSKKQEEIKKRYYKVRKATQELAEKNKGAFEKGAKRGSEETKEFKTLKSKEFYCSGDNSFRLQISTIDGEPFVSICRFYRPFGGYFVPTKKQVSLTPEAWEGLISAASSISRKLEKLGFSKENESGGECEGHGDEEGSSGPGGFAGKRGGGAPSNSGRKRMVVSSSDSDSGCENGAKGPAAPRPKGESFGPKNVGPHSDDSNEANEPCQKRPKPKEAPSETGAAPVGKP